MRSFGDSLSSYNSKVSYDANKVSIGQGCNRKAYLNGWSLEQTKNMMMMMMIIIISPDLVGVLQFSLDLSFTAFV